MVTKPLTKKQIKDNLDKDGYLCVDVAVDFNELLDGIESLNDLMDERILKSGTLSDISYQVVGSLPPKQSTYIGGEVILRVTASVEEI